MHEKKNVETKINCREKNEGEMDGDGDLGRLSRPSRKIHENESLSSPLLLIFSEGELIVPRHR